MRSVPQPLRRLGRLVLPLLAAASLMGAQAQTYQMKQWVVDLRPTEATTARWASTNVDMGLVALSQTVQRTVALFNDGNLTANFSTLSGTNSGTNSAITIDAAQCAAVAPGTSCAVTLTFSPSATGTFSVSNVKPVAVGTVLAQYSNVLRVSGVAVAQGTPSGGPGTSAGIVSVTSTSLTFARQQVASTSAAQFVTLGNTGTAPLTFSGISVTSGSSDFAQSNTCTTLAVGATCTVAVAFTPSAPGALLGTVSFLSDGAGATTLSLSGTGQAPSAALSAVDFGATLVGSSASATATLTNTGSGPLSLTSPTSASVSGTDFSFVATDCTAALASAESCTVSVQVSPSTVGARTGTLSVASAAGTVSAALTASGIQGNVSLSSASLNYDVQQSGTTSAVQTVTLSNTGTASLSFSGISVTSGSADFAQSNTCASVDTGATCSVSVSFTPSAAGARTGTITLLSNGTGMATISLAGTGQAPSATLSTPTLTSTPVGAHTLAVATLTNTGLGALSVTPPSSASVTGADFSFVSTTCSASLAAGGTCATTVQFAPGAPGSYAGTLNIATGAGTLTAALGSTGIQGFASMSPSSLSFAPQQVNASSAAQVVTVTNTGTDVLSFTGVGIATGMADFGQDNNCTSIAVGATCSVSVLFTPITPGALSGTLGFTHNGGGIALVTLSGTGQSSSATLSTPSFSTTTQVGTPSTASATLTNTGVGPISLTTPSSASVTGTDFSFASTTCTASLGASDTCTVTLQFLPMLTSARTGALSFATDAGTVSAALLATGVQGHASFSAPSLTYPGQLLGTTSTKQTVTLVNDGTSALVYSDIHVTTGASDFGQSNTCASVAVNASCAIDVTFTPSALGARSGSITLTGNGGAVASISLLGTGQAAVLAVDLGTQAFGNVNIGGTSAKTYTVTNNGNLAATLGYSPVAPGITRTGTCATTLAPATSCTVILTYAPTDTSTVNSALTVSATNTSVALAYSGTGVALPSFTLSSASVAFGNVLASTTAQQVVAVNNSGNVSLTTPTITPSGIGYSAAHDCAATLAVGASCTITLTFTPATGQSYPGSLSVSYSGLAPKTVALTGTGFVELTQYVSYRAWSDGTAAASCNDYRTAAGNSSYTGAIGDGVYRINLSGTPTDVFCDMTTNGGGWTRLAANNATFSAPVSVAGVVTKAYIYGTGSSCGPSQVQYSASNIQVPAVRIRMDFTRSTVSQCSYLNDGAVDAALSNQSSNYWNGTQYSPLGNTCSWYGANWSGGDSTITGLPSQFQFYGDMPTSKSVAYTGNCALGTDTGVYSSVLYVR